MKAVKHLLVISLLYCCSCSLLVKELMNNNAHNEKVNAIMKTRYHSIAFSPDNQYFACSKNARIFIYKTEDWSLFKKLKHHTGLVEDLAFSPQGNLFVSSGLDKKIVFWDTKTWKVLLVYKSISRGNISFSPDGSYLVLNKHRPALAKDASFSSRIISLYPFISEKKIFSSADYHQIVFPQTGKYFLTLENTGLLQKFSLPDFQLIKQFNVRYSMWNDMKFLNDKELIIHTATQSGFSLEHTFLIFNLKEGRITENIDIGDFDLSSYTFIFSFHLFNKNLILLPYGNALIVYSLTEKKTIRRVEIDDTAGEGTANDKYFVFSTGSKVLVYRLDNLKFVKELKM